MFMNSVIFYVVNIYSLVLQKVATIEKEAQYSYVLFIVRCANFIASFEPMKLFHKNSSVCWNIIKINLYWLISAIKHFCLYATISKCILWSGNLKAHLKKIGCHIGGKPLNNFSYADDLAILAPSAHALNKLLANCDFPKSKMKIGRFDLKGQFFTL